jgi:hypothetical protein
MLFVTEYRFKSHLTREDSKRLMDVFGKQGQAPGEIAHYVRVDGSGGFVVTDTDDPVATYESVLGFVEFMEFSSAPVLKIDDAVGPILANLAE